MVRLEQDLLADAALAWDTPRLATSLVWLESFLEGGRTMFVDCRGPLAAVGVPWNRRSLDLLTRHITSSPPLGRTRGEHVSHAVAHAKTQLTPFTQGRLLDSHLGSCGGSVEHPGLP